jgi:hypothetical protein
MDVPDGGVRGVRGEGGARGGLRIIAGGDEVLVLHCVVLGWHVRKGWYGWDEKSGLRVNWAGLLRSMLCEVVGRVVMAG